MPKLATKEYCTGCTACASACPKNCISLVADENGFLFPVINAEYCVDCGLCEKACPMVTPLKTAEQEPKAYAAYSKDEAVRIQSSSGGVFTEIAKAVLADGGVVFGAAYNEQFEVMHICVDSETDLAKLRGAKYAQSNLCGIFADVKAKLNAGQKVLFSGTPCQVAGLKASLRRDYENLLTVDFVCHSVPSPMAWREYVKYRAQMDNGGQLPKLINLRSKETGWSRYRYSNLFQYADGTNHSARSGESLYMKLFVGGYISRESCANCQFKGYSRVSDLTIGDFWGIWNIAPEMDDNKGTSLVLVQSEKGAVLLERIRNRMMLKPVTLEEASRENPAIVKTMAVQEKRQDALRQLRDGRIDECEAWFQKSPASQKRRLTSRIRQVLGRIKSK